uniref:Serpentine receptor class gamma n=1 Tax=Strongyloides papillosus TaxID=174720 RepID=A0A0N5C0C4_STREA
MFDIVSCVEIIQLIYKIPSMLLMMLTIYVIIKEIKNKNVYFNKQFYTIIVCKLINEIIFIINIYVFTIIPKWGFYNHFLENNNWTAGIFLSLASQQTTFMFFITLLISINRYVAVKYPLSYKIYFSKSKIVVILLSSIMLSTMFGLVNISFKPRYIKYPLYGYIVPYLQSKDVIYYQVFCQIFLFGIISITTCTLNVIAILTLKKHNLIGNKYKKELHYTTYSIFVFITLFLIEAFFVCRFITVNYAIKFFSYIANFLHVVAFDLTYIGNFYFLLYSW